MTNSSDLSVEEICFFQSSVISFPAVFALTHSPSTSFMWSVGHFLACEIRQRSNIMMESQNSYDIYDKSAAGALAGMAKYSFNDVMTSTNGITGITLAAGAFNNYFYHLEPEINSYINNSFGEAASSLYPYISPVLIEGAEGALRYTINSPETLTKNLITGANAGILLSIFSNFAYPCILDKYTENKDDIIDYISHAGELLAELLAELPTEGFYTALA